MVIQMKELPSLSVQTESPLQSSSPIVDACRHLVHPNGSIVGQRVALTILPLFSTLSSALPGSPQKAALASIDGRKPVHHDRLREFVEDFGHQIHSWGYGRGHRIALVLPNGPELALAILAVSNWACCVPLNAGGAKVELESDIARCGADLVIGIVRNEEENVAIDLDKDKDNVYAISPTQEEMGDVYFAAFDHVSDIAERLGIPYVGLAASYSEGGLFRLIPKFTISDGDKANPTPKIQIRKLKQIDEPDKSAGFIQQSLSSSFGMIGITESCVDEEDIDEHVTYLPNNHDDEVLILFTSGTTGSKKIVPHRLGDVMVASTIIALSWDLKPSDVNCNLMPLFHVGGIIRQIFSPILSGGSVICCPSFDPSIFWELMDRSAFSWYYAAPTMHQMILQADRPDPHKTYKLRMIANAAGALLPSLAVQLRDAFNGAYVLPSYGMTECMPISSPPFNYCLERPGTSGVAVGPEIGIFNTINMEMMPTGEEGSICVRGAPCFRGYSRPVGDEARGHQRTSGFLIRGWFNTGDLGYVDADGYIYITGRMKEVINRGGEIISPIEVEEAVTSHPDVQTCAAISVRHDMLQETVAIVVVPVVGRPRIDLPSLHEYLSSSGKLTTAKWPHCIIFMDNLPKSHTNKLLRVKLADRLGLPELNDGMYPIERTFEATCPPKGVPIQQAIPSKPVAVCPQTVRDHLWTALKGNDTNQQLLVKEHPSRIFCYVCYCHNMDRIQVMNLALETLDRYVVPSFFVSLEKPVLSDAKLLPPDSTDSVASIQYNLKVPMGSQYNEDPYVIDMQSLFQEILDLDCHPLPDTSFFNLGGTSMMASQLASKVRRKHNIQFSGAEVFHNASCTAMANAIKDRKADSDAKSATSSSRGFGARGFGAPVNNAGVGEDDISFNSSKQFSIDSQLNPTYMPPEGTWFTSLIQLTPLLVVFPLYQITRFFLYFYVLIHALQQLPAKKNFYVIVVTSIVYQIVWSIFSPLVFVLIKWCVIGKYKRGRYPIYSAYYIRWWFVNVCYRIFGCGAWAWNDRTLVWFYCMLGAKIGKGAVIDPDAVVAEFDLLSIGRNASIEFSTVRGFGVDRGCMILGPISIGKNAGVGVKAVCAPFTSVPDHKHLGPLSSSYETEQGMDKKHGRYNRHNLPKPHFIFQLIVGGPIMAILELVSRMPTLYILYQMINLPNRQRPGFRTMADILEWLCDVRRIPFYIGMKVARAMLTPLVYIIFAILIKRFIIRKFKPGPVDTTSQWQLLRHWLAGEILNEQKIKEVAWLIGRHYELVSILFRLLGAKVGKRVFWPGNLPIFTGEFDMLEIGDDVVFGSKAVIFFNTVDTCKRVIICAGANVSDNSVVLPGSIVGKNAVMGSNCLCPEDWYLREGSVWVGSKEGEPIMLEKGNDIWNDQPVPTKAWEISEDQIVMVGDETTLRPFGKAFYHRDASYFVWPLSFIVLFAWITSAINETIHTLPLIGALHGAAGLLYGFPVNERDYDAIYYHPLSVYEVLLFCFFWTHILRLIVWVLMEWLGKLCIIGHREEGRYTYDSSDYGQRWELYQYITDIRQCHRWNLLNYIAGSPHMSTWYRFFKGATIGNDSCLFPAGSDRYFPEPDLLRIGKRCVLDTISAVCHLNTKGEFVLAKIVLEDDVTIRCWSRVQQGVHMETGSMLVEKSLVLTGEVVEAGSIWQGAPASNCSYYT